VRWAALALPLAAVALAGCETSAEKSARLEKAAKLRAAQNPQHQQQLTITRTSRFVKAASTAVLSSSEGHAVVVTLRSSSPHALRDVPLQVTVHDARGASIYSNTGPGLARSLTSVPSLPAHGELTWVDDQVQPAGVPVSAIARVGEAPAVTGAQPSLTVTGTRLFEDPVNGIGAEGEIVNRSSITQAELVVYAVALRGGRIVAAGRALLPQAAANASTHFQVFFIGEPRGASLRVSAPPTTFR
jgi:hypothetical protein